MTIKQTPRMRLASLLIGTPVLDFIEAERAAGATWPEVRDAIEGATNGEVAVTWQAVQSWGARTEQRGEVA